MDNAPLMRPDAELFDRVDEVIHYIWAPIGICDEPVARREYHGYIPEIYARVKVGDQEKIVEYLDWIREERMGLVADKERSRKVALILLAWKNRISESTP